MKKLTAFSFLLFFSLILFAQTDSVEVALQRYKDMFTKGLISANEYEILRKQTLGIQDKPIQIAAPVEIKKSDSVVYNESVDANKMFRKGEQDSYEHFKAGGVMGGTFAATLFGSPLLGLIPAIICSSTAPQEDRLISKDMSLFNDPNYKRGYLSQAKRTKRSNAWAGWGIAFALDAIIATTTGLVVSHTKK